MRRLVPVGGVWLFSSASPHSRALPLPVSHSSSSALGGNMSSAVNSGRASVIGSLLALLLPISGIIATVHLSTPPVMEAEIKKAISIPCVPKISIPNTLKYIQWFVMEKNNRQRIYFQDMEASSIDVDTGYTHRISVDKNYSLTIDPVKLEDERNFVCQVGAGSTGSGEATTLLKVYGAAETPQIQKNDVAISVMEKSPAEVAQCITRNGYPVPKITWYKDSNPLQVTSQINNKMYATFQATQEASGLYTISSRLYYLPEKKDKDSKFYCEVSYRMPTGVEKEESERINISITYPTENVEIQIRPRMLKEMDNMTLECQSDGSSSVEYTFYRQLDGVIEDIDSQGNTAVINGVTRSDSGVYGCRVLDLDLLLDQIYNNVTVTVNYLDPIVLKPKAPHILTVGDKNVSISCEAGASQPTKAAWTKHKKTIVSSRNVLHLPVVTYNDAGNYSCKVTMPSVKNMSRQKTISIVVKGPPQVNCAMETFHNNGPHVNLTCVFKGYPMPKVACNGEKEPTLKYHHQKNYVVSELILPLTVEELKLTCNGTNALGSKAHSVTLERGSLLVSTTGPSTTDMSHAKSSGGVVIVVIIVCILLIAILGAVLYFLYKKGKIPCGRSGKQNIAQPEVHDNSVVEAKDNQKVPEETMLLQGVNGEKKPPNHQ
ncbi:cell surface glycoprotein MUC18-like isoform X2 [Narcine bancroftii]